MEKKKAVIYARFSSEKQTEQSIEGQIRDCKAYAKQNNIIIVDTYIDRAMTGTNDDRASFQRMLKDTEKGVFNIILVWKIDRFGRNREEIAFNRYKCRKNGVKVISAMEHIPDGPEGIILESLLEGMAEYYSAELRQKVRRGQYESALKGQIINASVPYGYKNVNKKYAIDETSAPIVKEIYSRFASGELIKDIINDLNSRQLKTVRGYNFGYNSIYGILTNERYTGVYLYKDEIRIEDKIPQIIDKDLFALAQQRIKKNKRVPQRSKATFEYLLTGKAFCGLCGSNLVGDSGTSKSGSTYGYYTCSIRKKKRSCKKKTIRKDTLEKVVVELTKKYILNEETINSIADIVVKIQEKDRASTYLHSLERRLKETEKAIGNLVTAIEQGIFSASTKNRLNELEAAKIDIGLAIDKEKIAKPKITKNQVVFWLESFRDGDIDDVEHQKRIIDTFVNAVYLYDDKIVISYNYRDDKGSTAENAKRALQEARLDSSDTTLFGPPIVTYPNTNGLYRLGNIVLDDSFIYLISALDLA